MPNRFPPAPDHLCLCFWSERRVWGLTSSEDQLCFGWVDSGSGGTAQDASRVVWRMGKQRGSFYKGCKGSTSQQGWPSFFVFCRGEAQTSFQPVPPFSQWSVWSQECVCGGEFATYFAGMARHCLVLGLSHIARVSFSFCSESVCV